MTFISIIFSCLFSIRMPLGIEGIINLGQDLEARRVPWFASGYHGTFWIFSLKPSGLIPIWCCLRPGTSHGLRVATMERPGFMLFQLQFLTRYTF